MVKGDYSHKQLNASLDDVVCSLQAVRVPGLYYSLERV